MAYEATEVGVERSQGAIRKLLVDHNVEKLAFGEERDDMGVRWAAVTFTHRTLIVRIKVPLKLVDEREVTRKLQRNRSNKDENAIRNQMYEQEEKRIWRVLAGYAVVLGDEMRRGSVKLRRATHTHRTKVSPEGAWTLVLMGPKVREWGFWKFGEWLPWREHERRYGFGMRCPEQDQ